MNQTEISRYFHHLFHDSKNPTCFADVESYELVYLNRAMAKLLNYHQDYQGKKCHQVIYGREAPCSFCPNFFLEHGSFVENYIYNPVAGQSFNVSNTLLDFKGQRINLCKYDICPSYGSHELSFEEAMVEYANICSSIREDSIYDALLELMGNFYQCQNTYLFGIYGGEHRLYNLNLWSRENPKPSPFHISNEAIIRTVLQTMESSLEDGVLEMGDLKYVFWENSAEFQLLDKYQIENLLLCPVHNLQEEIAGFLAIVNRDKMTNDMRPLKSVARFVEENFNRHKPFLDVTQGIHPF